MTSTSMDDACAWFDAQTYNYLRQRWLESIALGLQALQLARTAGKAHTRCREMLCDAAIHLGDMSYTTMILENHLQYAAHDVVNALLERFLQGCTAAQAWRVLSTLAWTSSQYRMLAMSLFDKRHFDAAERLGSCWQSQHSGAGADGAESFLPWVYWRQLRYQKALDAFRQAWEHLRHPDLLAGQALVHGFMGNYEQSVAGYRDVEQMRGLCGDDIRSMAGALFGAGHVRSSMEYNERRIETARFGSLAPQGIPRWQGQPLSGRLLVLCDPGWSWGDHLMYARYLTILGNRTGSVRIGADTALHRVLRQALPGAEISGTPDPGDCEAFVWLMSLPAVLDLWDTGQDLIPWLRPDEVQLRTWKRWWERHRDQQRGERRLRIGLCWRGNPYTYHDRFRSMSFDDLTALFERVPGVEWINLQLGAHEAPSPTMLQASGSCWMDPMPQVTDFMDTATIACTLDHVITVDSAVAHLCGSAGVPMTVLVPIWGEWRWQTTDRSVWYPSARLVRTAPNSTFRTTLQRLADELRLRPQVGPPVAAGQAASA